MSEMDPGASPAGEEATDPTLGQQASEPSFGGAAGETAASPIAEPAPGLPADPAADPAADQAPSTGEAAPPGTPNRRRWLLAGGAVLVVAAVIVAVVLITSGGGSSSKSGNANGSSTGVVVGAGGRQMISTLEAGKKLTYHATYRAIGGASAANGLAFELWQDPPRLRADTTQGSGSSLVRTESFAGSKGGHLCVSKANGPWSCKAVAATANGGPASLLSDISAELNGQGVAVRSDTIGSRRVTCFTVQAANPVELCATAQGVPVLIANASVRYELVTYSTSVDSKVFTPPAADTP